MKKSKLKKQITSYLLAAAAALTALPLTACNNGGNVADNTDGDATTAESTPITTAESVGNGGKTPTLTVLTHRTDRLSDGGDGTLIEMTKAFEDANNCKVVYQGYTDYSSDVSTMMSTSEYGDVLMIPDTVKVSDLGSFFEPLGSYAELDEKYYWANQKMYDGTVYGIAHLGTVAGGICYNKRVWADAGITELPKTPEEFLADLRLIRDNTDAIPYYTNFADASWTLVQWASLVVSASGQPDYENKILMEKRDLFVPGEAYYDVYKLMFDIFSDPTLIEEDPMTSDWEGCKAAINSGRIATMVMGSWAVAQFAAAGDNPDDIGYMPAPFSVDGVQYAQSAADYCMGVNKNRSAEIKELGKKYIEWFVNDSGFAQKEGAICTVKGSPLPEYLEAFENAELFIAEPYPDALVGVWNEIDNDSEVGTWQGDAANFKILIAEAALGGKGEDEFAKIVDSANVKWSAARDSNAGFTAYEGAG